jgi:hypothetical protein
MLVRLAFSVMIQVDADILLIDEVLAVGDAAFQQKCFDEFERIREDGTTVLLVTHDMAAVRRFCDRAVLLETGRVVETGDPERVGERYMELNFSPEARAEENEQGGPAGPSVDIDEAPVEEGERYGDGRAEIVYAGFEGGKGTETHVLASGHRAVFAMRVRFNEAVTDPIFGFTLYDNRKISVMSASSAWKEPHTGSFAAGEEATFWVTFNNVLGQGRYLVSPVVTHGRVMDRRDRMLSVVVTATRNTEALVDLPLHISIVRSPEAAPLEDAVS